MGRAIDMDKDISALKIQVKKLEDIVRGMTHNMDSMSEKSSKTTHIDLVDDVKTKEKKNGKKKANNKGTAQTDSDSSKSNGNSKSKNNKSGNSGS